MATVGRPAREGLDFLDLGIMQAADNAKARGEPWSAAGIAESLDVARQTVLNRIARLTEIGSWGERGSPTGHTIKRLDADARARAESLFRYVPKIAKLASGRTGDRDEVESAVQWALVRVASRDPATMTDFKAFALASMWREGRRSRWETKYNSDHSKLRKLLDI